MGLFRSIPLIERELAFLQEVNFTELQKELVRVRNLIERQHFAHRRIDTTIDHQLVRLRGMIKVREV